MIVVIDNFIQDQDLLREISNDNTFISICDGVGGWNNKGVDVSRFSWSMADNMLDK